MSKYIKSLFNSNYLFKVLFEQLKVLNLKKNDNYFFKEIKYKLLCSLLNPDFFDKNDFEKINNDIFKFILENKNDREIFSKTFFEQIIKFDFLLRDEKTKNNFNEVLKLIINNLPKSEVEELILKHKEIISDLNFDLKNNEEKTKTKEKIFSFFNINIEDSIICLKRDLLLKHLSIYFNDIYFNDKYFQLLYLTYNELYYKNKNYCNNYTVYDNEIHLPFPSRIKNFSNSELFLPKIFLTYESKFFKLKTFPIGHNYFKINKLKNLTPKISHYFPVNDQGLLFHGNNIYTSNYIIYNLDCELITNKDVIFGSMLLTNEYFIFQSKLNFDKYNNDINYIFSTGESDLTKRKKQIIIKYKNIEEVFSRRFLFMYQALEFFLLDGKSYFFNLFKIENAKTTIEKLKEIKNKRNIIFNIVENPCDEFKKKKIEKKWNCVEIETYQFLLYINKYGGRSYNDPNQYPIFPWIVLNFEIKLTKDNKKKYKEKYRKFIYPISVQDKEQRELAEMNFENSKEENPEFPFHFRLHYSNGAYVILYLSRLSPYTEAQIKLQNSKFDSPDRQFTSYEELIKILLTNNDNRELIPDLFYSFEYFYNMNYNFFGVRHGDKQLINNLKIPYSFNSPAEYVYYMRYLINNKERTKKEKDIKKNIHYWINNIFGVYQYEKKPDIQRYNTFNPFSYAQNCKFKEIIDNDKFDEMEKKKRILEKKISILLFGQTPEVLFKERCEFSRKETKEEKKYDEFIGLGDELLKLKRTVKISKNEIINFWVVDFKEKQYYFCLIQKNGKFYIKIWEDLQDLKIKIYIEKVKLFRKEIFDKKNAGLGEKKTIKIYKLNLKYLMFEKIIKVNKDPIFYFFICRNDDNTLRIYSSNNNISKKIKVDSFISTLHKINENNFFSGHENGRLMEWEVDDKINLKIKRDIFAHDNSMICSINYIKIHNILATSSLDGNIYIRKYFDFELLTIININQNEFVNDIIFSNYDMFYLLKFNKHSLKFNFSIYSINGLKVISDNQELYINDFSTVKNGKILFTFFNEHDHFFYYSLIDKSIKKFNLKEELKYKNQELKKFIYEEKKDLFYILFSNGDLLRFSNENIKQKIDEIKRKVKNEN